jgi:putative FmdB family regulatory protein
VPVYEYTCKHCGRSLDRLLPHDRAADPGPCPDCGRDDLRRRFSRVAVRLEGWGFRSTDAMVPERPGRGDFRAVRERAERLGDGEG